MAKTYLFQPDKKVLKQGFYMTDEEGKTVFEAKMLKQPLIGALDFDFVNHLTGTTTSHKVTKTMTTTTSGIGFEDIFATKSWFKLDGRKIWDFLHEKGVRINSAMSKGKLGMTYTVTLKNQPLATIATVPPKGKIPITVPNVYNVTAEEEDIDLAFLITFAIARTEQILYN